MSSAVNPPTDHHDPAQPAAPQPDNQKVIAQQRERFGGMRFGACFFGWLTATGTAVLLTALLAAAGTGLGLRQNLTANNAQTVGLVGGVVLLIVTSLAYFCGGYVAGRMARFNGAKQGVGVWLWAIIAAVIAALFSVIAGARSNVPGNLDGFPRIPIDGSALTTGGMITAIALLVAALLAAILGGIAGMRFHRKVDRLPLGSERH
jgi:hypothetical protein